MQQGNSFRIISLNLGISGVGVGAGEGEERPA